MELYTKGGDVTANVNLLLVYGVGLNIHHVQNLFYTSAKVAEIIICLHSREGPF